jgi:hypothetical protein
MGVGQARPEVVELLLRDVDAERADVVTRVRHW